MYYCLPLCCRKSRVFMLKADVKVFHSDLWIDVYDLIPKIAFEIVAN